MLFALALVLQMRGAASSPRPAPVRNAAMLTFLAGVRRVETEFFYLWRKEWEQDLAAKQSRESQIFDELDKSHGVTKPDAKPIQQAAQKIIDSEGSYYQKHPDAIPSKA